MVPPSSNRISRVPPYLICPLCRFVYGAITLYREPFHTLPLQHKDSAVPRSLAATGGISVDFFSYRYLDVSVPCVRLPFGIPQKWWVSPFGNPRFTVYLQTPRGLSHAITSFIASDCQGIHRVRLVTWSYNPKQSTTFCAVNSGYRVSFNS